jgi:hypothetical protein
MRSSNQHISILKNSSSCSKLAHDITDHIKFLTCLTINKITEKVISYPAGVISIMQLCNSEFISTINKHQEQSGIHSERSQVWLFKINPNLFPLWN